MNKSIKTVLLTLILLLSINNGILAETIYTEGAINYVIRDGSIVIINYFGNESKVNIPDHIGGYIVTGIASNALTKECIEEVVLPETVVAIEEGAIIEHVPTNVVDSYGNTITEDIENIKVDEEFYISSEEYDELESVEYINVNGEDVFEENETVEETQEEEEPEDFEEVYSAKVSTTVEENNYTLVIVCVVAVVCVILFVTLKKRKKKQG